MLITRMFSLCPGTPGWRQQAPAHDEAYLHAGAARLVEQVYHILVGEAVEFRLYIGFFAFFSVLYFIFYEFFKGRAHVVRGDEQLAAFERPVRRYEVEHRARVSDYLMAAGKQAEVGVYLRRRFVEIARADVGVAARASAFAPLDEYQLAVDL